MASKYERFLKRFGKLPFGWGNEDVKYQERVDKRKETIAETTPEALTRRFRHVRKRLQKIEEIKSARDLELEAVKQLLAQTYEDAGIRNINLTEGGGARIDPEIVVKVMDKQAMLKWIVDRGYKHHLTVNAQTLNSIVRELLLDDDPDYEPKGCEIKIRDKVVIVNK